MMKAQLRLPIAALILAATAAPLAAKTPCEGFAPGCFKGLFQGQDSHDVLPPDAASVLIDTTAAGTGAHVGQFSLVRQVTGSLVDFSDSGTARWIAADGGAIETTILGQAEISDLPGGWLKVTEIHTVTGGTGRFTGAGGTFTVELYHRLEPSEVSGGVETHDIFGSFHGTLVLPSKN